MLAARSGSISTMCPLRKLCCASFASSGSTPTTLARDPLSLMAAAMPVIESAAAYGGQHEVDIGEVLQNLKTDGALPGDHQLVVEGRDLDIAMLRREFLRLLPAFAAGRADDDHLCTHGGDRLLLHFAGIARHYNHGVQSQGAGGVSDTLRVIATGVSHYASLPLCIRERGNLVVSAAQLEASGRLEILRL